MTNRLALTAWTLLAPALAFAQQTADPSNASPVRQETQGTGWIWAIALVVLLAFALFGFRAMARRGPHGPRAPTPRGP